MIVSWDKTSDRIWFGRWGDANATILLYLVAAGIAWYLAAAGLILIVLSVLSYFMPNRHSGQKTLTAAAG